MLSFVDVSLCVFVAVCMMLFIVDVVDRGCCLLFACLLACLLVCAFIVWVASLLRVCCCSFVRSCCFLLVCFGLLLFVVFVGPPG